MTCRCWAEPSVARAIGNTADDLLASIRDAYDKAYPPEFLERFAIMECLGEGEGADTFLVQERSTEVPYIAKCYGQSAGHLQANDNVLDSLDHPNVPKHVATYEGEDVTVDVRTYVEGVSLDRHARAVDLSEQDVVSICVQLCDVLAYLHHRENPIIHRDIKPQNVIVRPDGTVALIDFDIARVYRPDSEASRSANADDGTGDTTLDTDTRVFGTRVYAAPEQYGFAQTDPRTDIYSLGVLLRYLLTGSPRENRKVRVYRPLAKIIAKCTAFDPAKRYSDVSQVKRALLAANPKSQGLRIAGIVVAALVAVALLVFAGVQIYKAATWSPFNDEAIPAALNDQERVDDALAYMKTKYGTNLFDHPDDVATVGLLRQTLIELYGLDRDYVYNFQKDGLPGESDECFMAWGWDDGQTVRRDTAVYAAVKVHDPSLVAEDQWSQLPDDNGEYPGTRVAVLFAEKTGILAGAGRPYDVTVGELALIFANADRVFDAAAAHGA